VYVVNRKRGAVIFDLLRERVSEPGEAAHLHPHGEVLPFDVAGVDLLRIGVTDIGLLFAADDGGLSSSILGGDVLLLSTHKRPNLIGLNALARKVHKRLVQICSLRHRVK
jgi:hypothetical protein